ncbi:hypothetical protein [Endozoicomonas sp. 8E]|uniref:hypothetical protein n=1 Tax=Endozoicomonas sp. 8E TaxID=3035692 RepID=UPI0039777DA8
MGYKTRVSSKGPDRGVDVTAPPDDLGLTQPRIKAEVEHRTGSMGDTQSEASWEHSVRVIKVCISVPVAFKRRSV